MRIDDKLMGKDMDLLNIVTTIEIEKELSREKYKYKYKKMLKSTLSILVIIVAISVLVVTFIFPVLQIYGESMEPTLSNGDVILLLNKSKFEHGDIVAFYYNNRILVKRVVATSMDWVIIDKEGNLFVNDVMVDEPYVLEKSYGDSDIEFPYQVPDGSYFILGDKRDSSIDSRNSLIGTISEEDIIGMAIFRVWPFNRFGITE